MQVLEGADASTGVGQGFPNLWHTVKQSLKHNHNP